MLVFLNGQFVPEDRAVVSVFDRSFLYGDGLFETVRVRRGQPFRWPQHLERLQRGAEFLGLKLPFAEDALGEFANKLIAVNGRPDGLLRLTLSRGVGVRGYSRLDLVANRRLMIAPIIEITTMPHADRAGVRLLAEAGVGLGQGFRLDVRGAYQARSFDQGGPTLGSGLAYAF